MMAAELQPQKIGSSKLAGVISAQPVYSLYSQLAILDQLGLFSAIGTIAVGSRHGLVE